MTLAKDVEQGSIIKKAYKIEGLPETEGDGDNSPLLFTITTDATDRDQDVVDPSGIQVENFKTNPVMQWAHQYDELPVGKSVEMFSTQIKAVKDNKEQTFNAIKARVEFQPDSNYHESYTGLRGSMVRRMYLTGFLNAVSIGFDPQEWVAIGGEEATEKTPSDMLNMRSTDGTKFTRWDLLEFSAVPVPANPQALINRDYQTYKKQLKSWADQTLEYCSDGECQYKELIKPYPAEHACRLLEPNLFKPNSFVRMERDHNGKKYSVILGRLKSDNSSADQAYRYDKTKWDEATAKAHCDSHKGISFEPAVSNASITETEEVENMVDKAGRVFSTANEGELKKIVDLSGQTNDAAKGLLAQLVAPAPAPTAPATPPAPAVQPPKAVSYPLGHDAPVIKEVEIQVDEAMPVIAQVEEVIEPEVAEVTQTPEEDVYIVDEDMLNEVLEQLGTQETDEIREE